MALGLPMSGYHIYLQLDNWGYSMLPILSQYETLPLTYLQVDWFGHNLSSLVLHLAHAAPISSLPYTIQCQHRTIFFLHYLAVIQPVVEGFSLSMGGHY